MKPPQMLDAGPKVFGKSETGEGSRGGHIVGHTKSGKPIYRTAGGKPAVEAAHPNFTADEHEEAYSQNRKEGHLMQALAHRRIAHKMRVDEGDKALQNPAVQQEMAWG